VGSLPWPPTKQPCIALAINREANERGQSMADELIPGERFLKSEFEREEWVLPLGCGGGCV